jgi:ABC-type glycerol-3-phosphate transport system substrate-binding protein
VKKFRAAAVLTAFLLFLAACGSKPSSTAPTSGGPAASLAKDIKPEGQADTGRGRNASVSGTTASDAAYLLMTTRAARPVRRG